MDGWMDGWMDLSTAIGLTPGGSETPVGSVAVVGSSFCSLKSTIGRDTSTPYQLYSADVFERV